MCEWISWCDGLFIPGWTVTNNKGIDENVRGESKLEPMKMRLHWSRLLKDKENRYTYVKGARDREGYPPELRYNEFERERERERERESR